ncbi:hypothetical protein [Actinomadura rubteroloni]|uniref:hypothetical protein n=1 Tax=Actinomadura rubteroloni TaxID=1926885 RepID=UPI0011B0249C|nr:hypothetical protein [Actinomadura rubteroloni]
MPAGGHLTGTGGRWTLRGADGEAWSGDFGGDPSAAPIVVESVAAIARRLASAERAGAALGAWTAVLPMIDGITDRLRPHPLEDRLRAEFAHLRKVAYDPHARLRTEQVLVPVSEARRITWRTVSHLAAHSETWAARRLHGVEPARLLTPVQVADPDLYENRIVATLIERLWNHVTARFAEIESIEGMVGQARDLLDETGHRPYWRERERLYDFIGELLIEDDLARRLADMRADLGSLRAALAPLINAKIRTSVRGPYTGPERLRPTNLFDHDLDYRHCRALWDASVALRDQAASGEPDAVLAEWCENFTRYALLLVLRALEQLGLTEEPDATGPLPDRPGPRYSFRGRTVRLDRHGDDTFALLLDDDVLLRIVPLPHALTRAGEPDLIARALDGLSADVAILYPGEAAERAALPMPTRLAVHVSHRTGARPAMVPVSPSDLASTGRVARALRASLDGRLMLAYPPRVASTVAGAEKLARTFDWITVSSGELLVTRPVADHERGALRRMLATLHTPADAARRRGDNRRDLDELEAELIAATRSVAHLTTCPVCLSEATDPVRAFVARADGTFRCSCQCKTVWETRRCTACSQPYPVLTVPSLADQAGGDGDRLDVVFAQDLLAPPCWQRPSVYICPNCDQCPEARSERMRQACIRCAPHERR